MIPHEVTRRDGAEMKTTGIGCRKIGWIKQSPVGSARRSLVPIVAAIYRIILRVSSVKGALLASYLKLDEMWLRIVFFCDHISWRACTAKAPDFFQ
mmetsp:Transcript_66299/g.111195  ORF Transcript_66299/g.111195 Transcript_66299/m.111195 type:complete len:96 (-) Transcript_66299:66-353(-)